MIRKKLKRNGVIQLNDCRQLLILPFFFSVLLFSLLIKIKHMYVTENKWKKKKTIENWERKKNWKKTIIFLCLSFLSLPFRSFFFFFFFFNHLLIFLFFVFFSICKFIPLLFHAKKQKKKKETAYKVYCSYCYFCYYW